MTRNPNSELYDKDLSGLVLHVSCASEYDDAYQQSIFDPKNFWEIQAKGYLDWFRGWDSVSDCDNNTSSTLWFKGGLLNACYNSIDRHVKKFPDKEAIIFEDSSLISITYSQSLRRVVEIAHLLKHLGVKKGDRVLIYMPASPELVFGMLACARIGAIYCLIEDGEGENRVEAAVRDCRPKVIFTRSESQNCKRIPRLKLIIDSVLQDNPVQNVVIFGEVDEITLENRDVIWSHIRHEFENLPTFDPEHMDSEDPLFITYSSPAIGKPKPLVHTHGGFLLWAAMSSRVVFELVRDDVVWCTSHPSSIESHSVGIYGTLLNGATCFLGNADLIFRDPADHQLSNGSRITKLCTSSYLWNRYLLANQKTESKPRRTFPNVSVIGINGTHDSRLETSGLPEDFSGASLLKIWMQPEIGGIALCDFAYKVNCEQSSLAHPFFGIKPVIFDLDTGEEAKFTNQEGALFFQMSWPGLAKTFWKDPDGFKEAYYAPMDRFFITGELAARDESGCFSMRGRIDDVIVSAGKHFGPWELELTAATHPAVIEATIVGFPHSEKGKGIYAFIRLDPDISAGANIEQEISQLFETRIGLHAAPDVIQRVKALPKTRSGKILRKVLEKIASGTALQKSDLMTLADAQTVDILIRDREELIKV